MRCSRLSKGARSQGGMPPCAIAFPSPMRRRGWGPQLQPAITMSVPEDPRIGGVPYQRSQCQPRRTQESEVLVDPPAPWGTRCREPGGCGTGGGQATLCVPLPYHLLIERVEDPARYKGWDPLSTRRPRIHPGAEVEVRGGIQSAASSGDARPKGYPRHPEMEALPYAP
jgi:hypothetical protein